MGRNALNNLQSGINSIVALLAEGVGRNLFYKNARLCTVTSPSSRRAWVEIMDAQDTVPYELVALLAEGVGRNIQARQTAGDG